MVKTVKKAGVETTFRLCGESSVKVIMVLGIMLYGKRKLLGYRY